jgi:hypothetical protein
MTTAREARNKSTSPAPTATPAVERLVAGPLVRQGAYLGPKCQGTKNDGTPCTAGSTMKSGYTRCFWHSAPEAERRAAVLRGGLASANRFTLPDSPDPDLSTPQSITEAIVETAGQVKRGELAPSVGIALNGLYRAALASFDANVAAKLYELETALASRARPIEGTRVEVES